MPGSPAAMSLLNVLAAASTALMVTLFIFGRANPVHATRVWMLAWLLIFGASATWWFRFTRQLHRLPEDRRPRAVQNARRLLATVSLLAAGLDVAVYASDPLNHMFTQYHLFRGVFSVLGLAALLGVFGLQEAILDKTPGDTSIWGTLRAWTWARATLLALVGAGAIGLLTATSYVTAMGDDYVRYWAIADALSTGLGYPASAVSREYQAGGMAPYLVDLPGLPLAMILSFSLLGHTVLAAMLPTILAGALFPVVSFLAFKELTEHTLLSFVGSVATALFPFLTFYVVRASEPDAMFLTLTMVMVWLAIRCHKHARPRLSWPLLGLSAALVALTRPEGIGYAAVTFLSLLPFHREHRGFWLATAVGAIPLAMFSVTMLITFGVPWPTSFVGTVRLGHIAQNVDGFSVWGLPRFAEALGIPVWALVLGAACVLLLFLLGSWELGRSSPALTFLAVIPLLSIAMFLLASPVLTRPHLPYDFFRRASYGLPLLALVATYPIGKALSGVPGSASRRAGIAALAVLAGVILPYEGKLVATPEAVYPGGTQILTSGLYLMGTDLADNPYPLPRLPFEWDGHAVVPASEFDYVGFRSALNSFYSPMDLHGFERATGYTLAALTVYLVVLGYLLMSGTGHPHGDATARRREALSGKQEWAGRTTSQGSPTQLG